VPWEKVLPPTMQGKDSGGIEITKERHGGEILPVTDWPYDYCTLLKEELKKD
jgi:hypothetical protein